MCYMYGYETPRRTSAPCGEGVATSFLGEQRSLSPGQYVHGCKQYMRGGYYVRGWWVSLVCADSTWGQCLSTSPRCPRATCVAHPCTHGKRERWRNTGVVGSCHRRPRLRCVRMLEPLSPVGRPIVSCVSLLQRRTVTFLSVLLVSSVCVASRVSIVFTSSCFHPSASSLSHHALFSTAVSCPQTWGGHVSAGLVCVVLCALSPRHVAGYRSGLLLLVSFRSVCCGSFSKQDLAGSGFGSGPEYWEMLVLCSCRFLCACVGDV